MHSHAHIYTHTHSHNSAQRATCNAHPLCFPTGMGVAPPLVALVAAGIASHKQGLGGAVHYGEAAMKFYGQPALHVPPLPNPSTSPRNALPSPTSSCSPSSSGQKRSNSDVESGGQADLPTQLSSDGQVISSPSESCVAGSSAFQAGVASFLCPA